MILSHTDRDLKIRAAKAPVIAENKAQIPTSKSVSKPALKASVPPKSCMLIYTHQIPKPNKPRPNK